MLGSPIFGNSHVLTVESEARKLEHHYPHALKAKYRNPSTNFLGFTMF